MNQKTASLYPYLDDSIEVIGKLGVTVNKLEDDKRVLQRAVERIQESLMSGVVSHKNDSYIELVSFPVSVIFVRLIGESYLARRFALAESERAMVTLHKNSTDRLIKFASDHFGFLPMEKTDREIDGQKRWVKIHFTNYLGGIKNLRTDPRWKLVNRVLEHGMVYITKHDLARLIKEYINYKIYDMVSEKLNMKLPDKIHNHYVGFKQFYNDMKPEMEQLGAVNASKYPPCIKEMMRKLQASINLSHAERFGLTSFLLRIGVDVEEAIEMYNVSPDWDERKAREQVEHIANKNGGEGYEPPSCATLQTQRLCYAGENKLCAKAKHPMSYYAMATWVPPKGGKKTKKFK